MKTTIRRLQSGYLYHLDNNVKVGRSLGEISKGKLIKNHSDVVKFLRKGQSIRNTTKLTGKSVSTVQRVKKSKTLLKFREVRVFSDSYNYQRIFGILTQSYCE